MPADLDDVSDKLDDLADAIVGADGLRVQVVGLAKDLEAHTRADAEFQGRMLVEMRETRTAVAALASKPRLDVQSITAISALVTTLGGAIGGIIYALMGVGPATAQSPPPPAPVVEQHAPAEEPVAPVPVDGPQ
jgi:hypothetical protein